jgi:uncharacterized membrane protein YhaH (DUF805 family)
MTFLQAIKTCLVDKPFTFSGRASRSEFWWFVLFYVLIGFLIGPASEMLFPVEKKDDLFRKFIVLQLTPQVTPELNPAEKKELANQYLADWFKPKIIPFAINVVINLFITIIAFSVACRRLHDINKSGWWQLINGPLIILTGVVWIVSYFAPLDIALDVAMPMLIAPIAIAFGAPPIWFVVLLVIFFSPIMPLIWLRWMIKKGTPGPNRFGEDPLQQPQFMNTETGLVAETNHPAPAGHPSVGGEK